MLKNQPRLPCLGLCLSIVEQLYLRKDALVFTSSLFFGLASKSGSQREEQQCKQEGRDWHLVPMAPSQLCTHTWQAKGQPPLPSLELSKVLRASQTIWVAGKPGRTLVLLTTQINASSGIAPGCSGLCSVGSWNTLQGWKLHSEFGLGCCWALDLKLFSAQIPDKSVQALKMKKINWEPGMAALGDKGPRS